MLSLFVVMLSLFVVMLSLFVVMLSPLLLLMVWQLEFPHHLHSSKVVSNAFGFSPNLLTLV